MKRIVFTGGGTAGHVTPNIALIPKLKSLGYDIHYIGSYEGIERKLIEDYRIPYYGISTGKLRRYFDLKNFSDPFRVIKGFMEAKQVLKTLKPDIVFSKGGFVSVPVVRAASSLKIPCIIHESDMTPGLANSLCIPVAKKVCCNFPETLQNLPEEKAVLTGSPIRAELTKGSKEKGLSMCGFHGGKPVIMVIGGSLGAAGINTLVREALPKLLDDFQIVHICGKEKIDNLLLSTDGYKQFEYVKEDLKDLFAIADIVISRAGANAICELLALRKPSLLIPLPARASRGDQILNAKSFEAQGFAMVADEDYLTAVTLTEKVHELYFTRQSYIESMQNSNQRDAIDKIVGLIEGIVNS
ncbi:undecaprenyldiphospho-muramoylpentapeptide beta-N-acetylglucosaminyltransferase [Lachnospiraceae bacterium MD335]|jgi:UDP-N-acetylglucosamine--N-acetylmuramyl-(pentapeptide) pyrophosphoryl-undecaprenol N-acetylglucosamine transferase|nr:undecaprenyldiphospho-muramoylpentapeptide beta-N-acetylglucosaminyltransferase [Lachnospiraceae bacterium MD335]